MRAVIERDVADARDLDAVGLRCERRDRVAARNAIGDPDPHLDQLVIRERPIELGDDRCSDAFVRHLDQRMERVTQSAQVFALSLIQCRGHARQYTVR